MSRASDRHEVTTRRVSTASVKRQVRLEDIPKAPRWHGEDKVNLQTYVENLATSHLRVQEQARYQLMELLGSGGQGKVYCVRDHECLRDIALKILRRRDPKSSALHRFINEARVTAQLVHPGVPQVYDLGILSDGTVFYTMNRLSGRSFADILKEQGGKEHRRFDLIQILLRVCDTLDYAHSLGVIHRDVKPANIQVGDYGEVLLLDWGLCKVLRSGVVIEDLVIGPEGSSDEPGASSSASSEGNDIANLTMAGSAVGTPYYMSPEQALGRDVSFESDVFPLGVILYEILSGRSPYNALPVQEILQCSAEGRWLPLREAGSNILPQLCAIVEKAMARNPEERYPSPQAFAEDLRRWLSNQAITAYKESRIEFVRRYVRRHAVVIRSVSVAVLVSLVLGLGLWGFSAWNRACKIDQYVQEARGHESANRLHEAQVAWKGILALDPGHAEAKRRADDLKERIETAARIEAQRAKMREESAKVQGGDLANGRLLASAKDLFAEAKKLMESGVQGCAQQAGTQFATILATIPKKADGTPINRDFETLDAECQKALKRAEQLDSAEKTRLIASLKGSVSTHLSKGDLPGAWGAFGQLTRISAMTPEIENLRGSLEQAEKKADAIKRMTEANTHFDRGTALFKEGKFDEAAQEFRDVQVLIPGQDLAVQAGQQQKDCIIAANKRKDERILAESRAKLERLDAAIVGALKSRQAASAREHLIAFAEAIRANPTAAVGYDLDARRRDLEALETDLNTQKALSLIAVARQALTESAQIISRKAQEEEELNGMMCRLSRGQFAADNAAKTGQLRNQISKDEALRQSAASRAMTALHEARRLAPEHAEVKAAFADWCAQRVQEAILNNLDVVAQAAADEGNLYDIKKRYSLLFNGQGRLRNQSTFPLELRRLEADSRGYLVGAGQVVQVAAGAECVLACGRYQADGKTRVTFRLGRAQEIQLKLPTPAKVPNGLAFHPGGLIRDRDPQNGTLGSQRVEVKPFLMGVTEVTTGEWLEFLLEQRDAIKATWDKEHRLVLVPRAGYYAEIPLWQHDDWRFEMKAANGANLDAQLPVEYISRTDVDAFLAWRSRRDGVSWRLPTEAEWQIAVENGDGRPFPWGDTFDAGACAPMSETRRESKQNGENNVRVGSRPADYSPHGFKDLSGSVGEFVSAVFQTEDPDYALVAGGISFMDRQPHRFSAWGRRSVERRIPCRGIGLRLALDAR